MGDAVRLPDENQNIRREPAAAKTAPAESFHAQTAQTRTPPQVFLGTKPTVAPKAGDKVLDWQDGDRVRHAIFGEGIIEDVEGKGPSQIVRVRFKNGIEKRLTALYAPLTRLE